MNDDLKGRPGYQEDRSLDHPLTATLRKLVRDRGLHGAVLISFYDDRVGVNSAGRTMTFGAAMETLGDKILAAIDDGQFGPDAGES